MQHTMNRAKQSLLLEYKNLQNEPVEGFRVKLLNDSNMFEWLVAIYGPPNTIYEGGYFRAHMTFPLDYPFSPPSIRFVSKLLHPNIYANGNLCISILHPPFDDPTSGELASERWNPTQNVRTILLSVISLLNEPNIASPANVDASLMYKRWIDSGGKDNQYVKVVRKQVKLSKADAAQEGVIVPMTVEDYCASGVKTIEPESEPEPEPEPVVDDSEVMDMEYFDDLEDYEEDTSDSSDDTSNDSGDCENGHDNNNGNSINSSNSSNSSYSSNNNSHRL